MTPFQHKPCVLVVMPFSGEHVDCALDILNRGADDEGPGADLDAEQNFFPVDWCILKFVERHGMLPVVDGGITEEDEDGFNAGRDVLFGVSLAVGLCRDVVVNVHIVGYVDVLAVGTPYSSVKGVWGGLGELGLFATKATLPLEAIEVVVVLCAEGLVVE